MSAAYARKVKISNLKEMARTVVFIQDLGIHSWEKLKERQAEISSRLRSAETRVKDTDSEIRKINQQIHFAGQYYANLSVHTDFMKAWNKGRFRSGHRDELDRYDEAVKFFKDNNAGSIPLIKDLKERKEVFQSENQQQLASLNDLQQAQKNLQTAVTNVEAILGKEKTKKRELTQTNQPPRNTGPSF